MLVLHCIQFTNYFDKWNFSGSYYMTHIPQPASVQRLGTNRFVLTDRSFWTCTPRKLLLLFRFLGHHVDVFITEQTCSKLKKVEHNLEYWVE